ncbi:PP2C family protein-serine/threonine phosphatase [Aquihabitans sp. McL0605]|uniref:PP2C family protein-serine/threonine phosphatase n=1 Tax=Aquihabitans sp. McL0605 TaxID=3415671 RepID=UPI003CF797C9
MTDLPAKTWAPPEHMSPRDAPHLVVLVEDDPGDTILFEAAIRDADPELKLRCVTDAAGLLALAATERVSCVVLDLGLPGATGFEALDHIVELGPPAAIVVLTGWGDAQAGIQALARGAQDYLVKGEVDGRTIARSIRFAVERKRSQLAAAALVEANHREQEQHRLERALLIEPAVVRPDVRWTTRYIAARAGVVSGDFYDGIELPDGTLRFVVGDVAGHGTDEAALGVGLRAAWRALVLAGLDPAAVLLSLEDFLLAERPRGDEFATVCDLTIASDLHRVCVRSAGHPPPVLAGTGALHDTNGRSPLGIRLGDGGLPGTAYELADGWSIATYTDGLFEVRDHSGAILPVDQVPGAVEAAARDRGIDADALIAGFAGRAVDGWRDDVAVLVVEHHPGAGAP